MSTSTRPAAVPMIAWLVGLGSAAALLVHAGPAFGLESAILHVPPAGYHQVAGCSRILGHPYQQNNPAADGTIQLLFYRSSGLTSVVYLIQEQVITNGQSLTLFNDLGELPVASVSFEYSKNSPFPSKNLMSAQFRGPYYVLWVYLDVESMRVRTIEPC